LKNTTFSWLSSYGKKIFAQEWQPDGDPRAVIALVHGLGEHSGRYQMVAETFTKEGFALLGFDLPGHGQSEGQRGHTSFDDVGYEIDHLLAEICQRYSGKPVFLYGHSLGGHIVLYHTLKQRPDLTGVIATSPGLAPGTQVPEIKVTIAKVMSKVMPTFAMASGLESKDLCRDTEIVRKYREDTLVHDRVSARLGYDILFTGAWTIKQASNFPLPLLLVQGAKDCTVSVQATCAFAEKAPPERTTFKLWEDLVHETHNEPEKEQVLNFITGWMSEQIRQVTV
jgi:alpha-beta hydrolase superfamily lysophospholipase